MSGPHEFVLLLSSCIHRGGEAPRLAYRRGGDTQEAELRQDEQPGWAQPRPVHSRFQVRAFKKGSLLQATRTVSPVLTKYVLATANCMAKAGLFLKHNALCSFPNSVIYLAMQKLQHNSMHTK